MLCGKEKISPLFSLHLDNGGTWNDLIFKLNNLSDIIDKLTQVLIQRKKADADSSYVASLYAAGTDKILKKLGEEAVETVIAGKTGSKKADKKNIWKNTCKRSFGVATILHRWPKRSGDWGNNILYQS